MRESWGKVKVEYFNFTNIAKYHRAVKKSNQCLSEKTRVDIDFDDVFAFVDRTTSRPGQQYLYDKLSQPVFDLEQLRKLDSQVNFFSNNKNLRELTQLGLLRLGKDDAYDITSLISDELDEKPKWYRLIVVEIVVVLVLLALSFYKPVFLIWLLVPFIFNLGIHYWNKNNIFRFIHSFPQLDILINLSKDFVAKNLPFESEHVVRSIQHLKGFQVKRRFLSFGDSSMSSEMRQVLSFIVELVKAFFLVEFFTYFSLSQELKGKRQDILNLFRYVGEIDSSISIASLRAGSGQICKPVFTDAEKKMCAKDLYHPLIEDCVPNSIKVDGKSILITGSNMSGKSSFLRTVAVNALFAQTIYTCFASEFHTPFVRLSSSIRIDDSMAEGKSYYFEEVSVIGKLVKEASEEPQNLFILDEVFKGTNTVERIAAAKAILTYLNQHDNIVFVSTHDIELAELLKEAYELYHFTEVIVDNKLHFDHILKTGKSTTRNAIAILAISGYPPQIIEEAKTLAQIRAQHAVPK
ncbi:MAG: hypothetical protein QM727_14600 [Niabella sp.]